MHAYAIPKGIFRRKSGALFREFGYPRTIPRMRVRTSAKGPFGLDERALREDLKRFQCARRNRDSQSATATKPARKPGSDMQYRRKQTQRRLARTEEKVLVWGFKDTGRLHCFSITLVAPVLLFWVILVDKK